MAKPTSKPASAMKALPKPTTNTRNPTPVTSHPPHTKNRFVSSQNRERTFAIGSSPSSQTTTTPNGAQRQSAPRSSRRRKYQRPEPTPPTTLRTDNADDATIKRSPDPPRTFVTTASDSLMHRWNSRALLAASLAAATAVCAPMCGFGARVTGLVASFPSSASSPPTHLRSDREAYLQRRRRGRSDGIGDGNEDRRGKRHREGAPRDDDRRGNRRRDELGILDDPSGCGLYSAPSSIPGSGLGVYTTALIKVRDVAGQPEIGIAFIDPHSHHPGVLQKSLLNQYPWSAKFMTGSHLEALEPDGLIPSLGMLANSHPGMKNARIDEQHIVQHQERYDRDDPGRGATSDYFDLIFRANHDITVEEGHGTEIFVDYGEKWFETREHLLGKMIPFERHFKRADELLREFHEKDPSLSWDEVVRVAEYEILLEDEDPKVLLAMPNDVEHVERAVAMGAARYSVPHSKPTVEWLDENGFCMDNLRAGRSPLPNAGNGAFAVRNLSKGSVVATTPVLTIHRNLMVMYEPETPPVGVKKNNKFPTTDEVAGHQLLLNYCYGHVDSSLLFFPYSSTVHFINHAGRAEDVAAAGGGGGVGDAPSANAEIRWSESDHHDEDLLSYPLVAMFARMETGLMFDIVATRDILLGEEVLIDYGPDWNERWNEHIASWSTADSEGGVRDAGSPSLRELNDDDVSPIRTEIEQLDRPYPSGFQTTCVYEVPEDVDTTIATQHNDIWKMTQLHQPPHPCKILKRESYRNDDAASDGSLLIYTYIVVIAIESQTHVVRRVPRYAIRFDYAAYRSDQHARGAFRHEINLPEGVMPGRWMDQRRSAGGLT